MHCLKNHYHDVIQKDLILSENISTVAMLPALKKIDLALGGSHSDENFVIASLGSLNILTGQKPYLTQQKPVGQKSSCHKEAVGGKLTLRGSSMFNFLHKLLFGVFPHMRQFEGLRAPLHKHLYCFVIKDIFSFQELVPLFIYFESVGSLQCQFYFTTKSESEVVVLGNSLQLCFLPVEKQEKRK